MATTKTIHVRLPSSNGSYSILSVVVRCGCMFVPDQPADRSCLVASWQWLGPVLSDVDEITLDLSISDAEPLIAFLKSGGDENIIAEGWSKDSQEVSRCYAVAKDQLGIASFVRAVDRLRRLPIASPDATTC